MHDVKWHRAAVFATVMALSGVAGAQSSPEVEAEHARGMALREQHRDQEAAEVFRALYERTREPRALARLALAEGAQSRWVEAEQHMATALAQSSDGWVAQNRAALEGNLATMRSHLANLEVQSNVSGARWFLDGQERGSLPMDRPARVIAGTHVVEVRAEGHTPARRTVEVAAGYTGLTRETVPLTRAESTAVAAPSAPAARVMTPREAPVTPPTTEPASTNGWMRPVGIAALVAGGVGLGVGVAGLVLRNGAVSDFAGQGCWLEGDAVRASGGTTVPSCSDVYDRGQGMQTLSTVGFVAGGVFAAAGVVLMVVAPSGTQRASAERASWGCGAGPGTVGVACGGRF